MHETESKNFRGYIDSTSALSNEIRITGWVVALDNPTAVDKLTFSVVDSENKEVTPVVTFKQRDDVFAFYNNQNRSYLNSGFEVSLPPDRFNCTILINGENVFNIALSQLSGKPLEEVIRKNNRAKPNLVVVDNFYEDPDQVRAYALEQQFIANEKYHKGSRTENKYIPNWIQGEFERLLGRKVTEFVGATGVFQYCVAKDSIVYHFDTQEYAAMVYLSPNAPLDTGTCTYRSKLTGMMIAATDEDAERLGMTKEEIDKKSFNGNNFYDKHNMELVDSIGNVYNRLVIFNGRALHAASSYYGDSKENGRLFQLFFFNC